MVESHPRAINNFRRRDGRCCKLVISCLFFYRQLSSRLGPWGRPCRIWTSRILHQVGRTLPRACHEKRWPASPLTPDSSVGPSHGWGRRPEAPRNARGLRFVLTPKYRMRWSITVTRMPDMSTRPSPLSLPHEGPPPEKGTSNSTLSPM